MMTGMILAVFLYRPIYREMMVLTDTSKKFELVDQRSEVRANTNDTVTTITQRNVYADQTVLTTTSKEISSNDKPSAVIQLKKEVVLGGSNYWMMIALISVQVFLVTMVYGPIAAFLVELFPTRIRYTSMSLPYHIGNGIFGGLTPFIATYLSGAFNDPLAGLWYPIGVAAICFVLGMALLSNKRKAEVLD